ncbi:MAG: hypothetical protein HY852_14515 [Bradyrhizobium sp.]|uniref:hypothetical protein n=1 Tax=Bradyrhizobium sp. TaxID=376 RepID=UPI0025C1537E|nr:hypothetical protein [Bradyrhizobium sp.]MBI5263021.1 hypothetical protein [Bradyrhizobium sp.]
MKLVVLSIAMLVPAFASAQTPYSGMQSRHIKALSDQQISDLQAGRGMGFALAAELNGYPGPSHVLELADRLGLSAEQRGKVQEMFAAMKSETTPIGTRLIDQETHLDREFANRTVSLESLKLAISAISKTLGELREAHLKYHLLTSAILDKAQLANYAEMRGYSNETKAQQHHNR